ncbi:hypothetical protein [Rhodoligotrophos appendicifer]|uniref:hypothetical protein n=1 Tax=Rhodoligotrophos appendicifer TaxID=987056 RepID=UPI0019612789|nr:hypothetical protein [Rhodoligotrophos appendicifer]
MSDVRGSLEQARKIAGPVTLYAAILSRCAGEPQNDTGNGQRLISWFGDDLLHVRDVGWHSWIGSHWEVKGGAEDIVRRAQETAERIGHEVDFIAASPGEAALIDAAVPLRRKPEQDRTPEDNEAIAKADQALEEVAGRKVGRRRFAVSSGNDARIRGMISQALPHKTVAPEDLDPDSIKFNVMNGTLRFRKVEDLENPDCDEPRWDMAVDHLEPDREDLITKVAPVRYDPEARCPKWLEFLDRFQPNLEVRSFLQVYSGYALTGLTGEQVLVFNYGTGANGKSTYIEALSRLMGAYAQSLNPEAVTGVGQRRGDQATPELARLTGARMVRGVGAAARGAVAGSAHQGADWRGADAGTAPA